MPVTCAACKTKVPNRKFITCHQCKLTYDLSCAHIFDKRFNLMSADNRINWKCQECRNKQPTTADSLTPAHIVQTSSTSPYEDFTCVNNNSSNASITNSQYSMLQKDTNLPSQDAFITRSAMCDIIDQLKLDMTKIIRQTISEVVADKLKEMSLQIHDFKESLSFFNERFETLSKTLDDNKTAIQRLQIDNVELNSTVKDLSIRLNLAEQHLRESNVELNGIPEHRTENLLNCLTQLCKTVNAPITDSDFTQVTRVAKWDKDSARPRTIVAKLRTPRQRDILLAAVHDFNKKNPTDKLNSYHLGIGGKPSPVFVAEHLTPSNKSLHAGARKRAKEVNYKYVWVRNGRIYARKDDNSQALFVRGPESIKLMM